MIDFFNLEIFLELKTFFLYVFNLKNGIVLKDLAFYSLNFLFVSSIYFVFYFLCSKKYFKIFYLILSCVLIYLLSFVFSLFNLHYTSYYFFIIAPYFLLQSLLQKALAFSENKISKNYFIKLKVVLYASINWIFSFFSFYYFIPKESIIEVGFIKFFIMIFSLFFLYLIYILRKIILEFIEIEENIYFKRILRIVYSSAWLFIVLFFFLWLSDHLFHIKLKKFFLSLFVFFSFYIFKINFKSWLISNVKSFSTEKEIKKMEDLNLFLSKMFFNPLIIFIVFYIWNINLMKFLNQFFSHIFLDKIIYCIICFVVFRAIIIFSDVLTPILIKKKQQNEDWSSRFETLFLMLNIIFKIFFGCIFLFIVLSIFQIDASPIFANFWVLTAGLSLGLQSLMKDLAVGIIMMFENAFNIGDEVAVGDVKGIVEEITLRLLKVRTFDGDLVSIPFSNVEIISNRSRVYTFVLFKLYIDVEADVSKVLELMNQAGMGLKKSTQFPKKMFLSDLKIFGPVSISSYGMLFEARIKIMPFPSRPIKSVYYALCKDLFEKENIKFSCESEIFKKFLS